MSWFRVDDAAAFHRKTLAAQNEAFGAWCRMGAHVAGQLTDGFIDEGAALLIAGRAKVLDRLVEVGFLERAEGGFRLHDYHDYNPRAAEIRAARDAVSAARAAAGRVGGQRSGEARRKQAPLGPRTTHEATAEASPEALASVTRSKTEANAKQVRSKTEAPSHPIPEEKKDPLAPSEANGAGGEVAPPPAPARPSTPAEQVFAHWCRVMDSPRSKFDGARRRAVEWALKHFDLATCLRAVDGCRADPFSMGENDRRKRFNDVSIIFRDAKHVEDFIALAQPASRPGPDHAPVPIPDAATVAANLAAKAKIRDLFAGKRPDVAALRPATGTEDDHAQG